MRILLVRSKPDYRDVIVESPNGLAYVGAMAERMNHEVEILDLLLERRQEDADRRLKAVLGAKRYDLVGITAMTPDYDSAAWAARLIKESHPRLPIVFGGQHATGKAEEVAAQDACDYVVRGEGEQTFAELIEVLDAGKDPGEVDGLAYKRNGAVVKTPPRAPVQDLDALPFPAYHLLDLERYFGPVAARVTPRNKQCVQIFTSRGCPWRCIYCHDLFGKRFRARSPENVLAEIKLLRHQFGIRDFLVEDDVFNFDMNRAKRIFDLVKAEKNLGANFQFNSGLRIERFDEELVRKMAEGGTYFISIAVESATPRIQRHIRKNLKLERVAEVVSWMRKYRIRTLGFFMLGFPSETLDEINRTIRFACSLDLDEALFSIVTPYPGSELSRQVRETSMYDPDLVSRGQEAFQQLRTEQFDFMTLKKLQRKAYVMFFLTRSRFLRLLPRLLNVKSSWKYLKAIGRVLSYGTLGGARSTRIN